MTQRISIEIFGNVQGVWFRKHVSDSANQLAATGFVKNLPNGTVYTEVQGTPKDLEIIQEACKTGSPQSQVERILVGDIEMVENETDFIISY